MSMGESMSKLEFSIGLNQHFSVYSYEQYILQSNTFGASINKLLLSSAWCDQD